MKKLLKGIGFALAFLVVTAGGLTVYHFATTSTFQLIAVYMNDGTPPVFRWSAEQALYVFHPDEQDVEQLNREAGAQYVVGVLDPEEARPVLKHLMDNGLDINSFSEVDGSRFTALHAAALSNNPRGVRLLLEFGADPTLKDGQGRTPLELVRFADNRENSLEDFSDVMKVLEKAQS
ncbi:ankyrin repeat protein [Halospina denitrificans]|uniref:Ankyrin repeat protein n=1 Tax=Halospina denitrificans TaxID=332522 RepID=A0A4V3EQ27_9GAMM|nr:ankyrin repeat domain-containing protein [Halospina denitrificans]TDT40208.1 ankyrin repeat protein [Halospina denitrificans]